MQKEQQNAEKRNARISNIRSRLKLAPIVHSTTDRVMKKIAEKQNVEEESETKSISLSQNNSSVKFKEAKPKNFESKYTVGEKLGQGAHGVVKKCFHKDLKKEYAVKEIRSDDEMIVYLKRNFANIEELEHPNIIKYKAFYFGIAKQKCMLVMDYLPYPSLSKLSLTPDQLVRVMYQVVLGLQYIHSKNICHRDIKPENILYNRDAEEVKIIDFGVSCKCIYRQTKKEMLTLTGTPFYRAPEMFTGGGYDEMVDMWAFGVMLFELVTGATPFESVYHSDTINNILKGEVSFDHPKWNEHSSLLKDLVVHLLKPREKRLTAKQTVNHFWFAEVRQEAQEYLALTKSAGFDSFFSLQRTVTENHQGRDSLRPRKITGSPNMECSELPIIETFLSKNARKDRIDRWINLEGDGDVNLDLIESEEEQTSTSPSPRIGKSKKAELLL